MKFLSRLTIRCLFVFTLFLSHEIQTKPQGWAKKNQRKQQTPGFVFQVITGLFSCSSTIILIGMITGLFLLVSRKSKNITRKKTTQTTQGTLRAPGAVGEHCGLCWKVRRKSNSLSPRPSEITTIYGGSMMRTGAKNCLFWHVLHVSVYVSTIIFDVSINQLRFMWLICFVFVRCLASNFGVPFARLAFEKEDLLCRLSAWPEKSLLFHPNGTGWSTLGTPHRSL